MNRRNHPVKKFSTRYAWPSLLFVLFVTAPLFSAPALVFGQTITRGPYLQLGTSSSIVIRWRTSILTDYAALSYFQNWKLKI
jgi:hypothetical protein